MDQGPCWQKEQCVQECRHDWLQIAQNCRSVKGQDTVSVCAERPGSVGSVCNHEQLHRSCKRVESGEITRSNFRRSLAALFEVLF